MAGLTQKMIRRPRELPTQAERPKLWLSIQVLIGAMLEGAVPGTQPQRDCPDASGRHCRRSGAELGREAEWEP